MRVPASGGFYPPGEKMDDDKFRQYQHNMIRRLAMSAFASALAALLLFVLAVGILMWVGLSILQSFGVIQ